VDGRSYFERPRYGVRAIVAAVLGVAVVVALVLGYLGTRYRSSAPVGPIDKVSIALPPVPHASLLYIAAAKGYFAAEGLEVAMIPAVHGKAALELVVEGEADLGTASEVVFVLAASKDRGLAIAANMLSSGNDVAVVARRDRGIASARDLAGRRIGLTLGTSGEYFLWALFIRHKLRLDSVTLVNVPPGEFEKSIAAGTVDAIVTWEPNVYKAQLALGENAVTIYEPLAYTETFNIIGRREFLKEHPRTVEKLLRAILRSEQFNRSEPDEALNLVAERLKIDLKTMKRSSTNLNFQVDLLQSQLITLEEQSQWAMARGYAERGPIPNYLPNLYVDALLAVRPERVMVAR